MRCLASTKKVKSTTNRWDGKSHSREPDQTKLTIQDQSYHHYAEDHHRTGCARDADCFVGYWRCTRIAEYVCQANFGVGN
jgi:hypothetical protein